MFSTIDYVVPMVFPDDASWRYDFHRVGGSYMEGHVRWRSWGTERLLIQSAKRNMPWLHDIIILLSGTSQKRDWMDEEGVRIVYHKEFIPKKFLPIFNSRSIEMFIKFIPGLSDMFIYGNDDMYPLSPLSKDDFFRNGVPCQKMQLNEFPEKPNNFHIACMGGLNFIAQKFGIIYSNTWLKTGHSLSPILKDTCEKVWEIGREQIEQSVTPFRNERNFNQYIYSWWQHFTNNYIEYTPKQVYASVKLPIEDIKAVIYDEDPGVVCINDSEVLVDYESYKLAIFNALSERINS